MAHSNPPPEEAPERTRTKHPAKNSSCLQIQSLIICNQYLLT